MVDDEETKDIDTESIAAISSGGTEQDAYLIFIAGPWVGETVKITQSETIVGRGSSADVTIQDPGVSREHARFHRRDDGVYVEDMGSQNGTFVNGTRIERFRYLQQGDKVTLGSNTIFKFAYQDQLDEEFQSSLLEAATRDGLTGVYNRRHLEDQLTAELAYSWRHNVPLSLILFDIDHFKRVNDGRGHLAGDAVLRQLADLVQHCVRTEDFVARYGGDEFAVICRGLESEDAIQLAERLRHHTEMAPFEYEGTALRVTISLGVASVPELELMSTDDLMRAADTALYRSKSEGRNLAHVYTPE